MSCWFGLGSGLHATESQHHVVSLGLVTIGIVEHVQVKGGDRFAFLQLVSKVRSIHTIPAVSIHAIPAVSIHATHEGTVS